MANTAAQIATPNTPPSWRSVLKVPEAVPISADGTAVIAAPCVAGTAKDTRANGQPAFGCYVPDEHAGIYHAHGIMVLTFAADRISAITRFTDSSIVARFGLPRTLRG